MPSRRQPFFSIVVPTYRRPERLAACLESLAGLDYPRDRFEVIVVDDGSQMPLERVVALYRERVGTTLLTQPNAGPAAARNAGAARARGQFLAFLDDDCTPAPDWLQTLEMCLSEAPDHAIGGRTLNALADNPYSVASQMLVDYLYSYYNSGPNRARFLTSNNLALPADRFRAIGGFSKSFLRAAAEDRELCDRWLHRGYHMRYAPAAVVYHSHSMTLRAFLQQHFNYGRGAFQFRQLRARRGQGRVQLESLSFYLNLVAYPFLYGRGWRAVLTAALLIASQAANAAGFCWQMRAKPSAEVVEAEGSS